MPRPRLAHNRPLPARWAKKNGAFFYRVPPGLEPQWDGKKWFRLGATLPEAHKVYGERTGRQALDVKTVGQLLDRYALEVVPTNAASSRGPKLIFIAKLRSVFADMPLADMKPQHVYQYFDRRGRNTSAHRELEVLSHAFTKAVEWGYIERHPFKGEVRLPGEKSRTRYVEDWEILEALGLPSRRKKGSVLACQAYMLVKLCTGLARSDLLRLEPARHFRDDGIHVQRHKTDTRPSIYGWGDIVQPDRTVVPGALRIAVEMALAARPVDIGPFLFCNRRGEGYIDEEAGTADGFDSMWGRFVQRVLKETRVTERFTEHDIRAKVGSDAENLERARALLQHADPRTTDKIYRRKPEFVAPATAGALFVFNRQGAK